MQDLCLDKLGVFEASRENQADGQAADADRRGLGGLSVSPSAPQPQTAPATLALLPGDVLARIFGFLDCPTQHSFIRVSRSLHAVKDQGRWHRQIVFADERLLTHLQPHSGQGPDQKDLVEGLTPVCRWLSQRAASAALASLRFQEPERRSKWRICEPEIIRLFLQLLMQQLSAAHANLPLELSVDALGASCAATSLQIFEDFDLMRQLRQHLVWLQIDVTPHQHLISSKQWSSVCSMENLQTLALCKHFSSHHSCGIAALTDDISRLVRLRSLTAMNGNFMYPGETHCFRAPLELSSGLSCLTQLTSLRLRGVGRDCLLYLSMLSSLCELSILDAYGGTICMPSCLSGLHSLSSLSFDGADMVGHISALGHLASLQHLTLAGFGYTEGAISAAQLGCALCKLTCLTYFRLIEQHNDFDAYEMDTISMTSLTSLSNLVVLVLGEVCLTDLEAPAIWPKLQELYLWDNELRTLPDLSGLSSLQTCEIMQQGRLQIEQPLTFMTLPLLRNVSIGRHGNWSKQSLFYLAEAQAHVSKAGTLKFWHS